MAPETVGRMTKTHKGSNGCRGQGKVRGQMKRSRRGSRTKQEGGRESETLAFPHTGPNDVLSLLCCVILLLVLHQLTATSELSWQKERERNQTSLREISQREGAVNKLLVHSLHS